MRNPTEVLIAMDVLGLVGHKVSKSEVQSWTNAKYTEILIWAGSVYYNASDNKNKIPKKPIFKSKELR